MSGISIENEGIARKCVAEGGVLDYRIVGNLIEEIEQLRAMRERVVPALRNSALNCELLELAIKDIFAGMGSNANPPVEGVIAAEQIIMMMQQLAPSMIERQEARDLDHDEALILAHIDDEVRELVYSIKTSRKVTS